MIGNPRLRIEIIVNVTGIRIGIIIIEFAKHWNIMLDSESDSKFLASLESESYAALVVLESLVPESFTTLADPECVGLRSLNVVTTPCQKCARRHPLYPIIKI